MAQKNPEELSLWVVSCKAYLVKAKEAPWSRQVKIFTLAATVQEAVEVLEGGIVAVHEYASSDITPKKLQRVHVSSPHVLLRVMHALRRQGYRPIVPHERIRAADAEVLFVSIMVNAS